MQRKISDFPWREYKPFGLVRFVCGISVLLRLLLRNSCGWPINIGRFRVSSLARRARFVSPALTVTGGMVNAGNAVTDATPTIRATVVDLQGLLERADLEVRVDNTIKRNFSYKANSGALSLPGGRMEEGRHSVEVTAADPSDPQAPATTKRWTFRVQ